MAGKADSAPRRGADKTVGWRILAAFVIPFLLVLARYRV